MTAYDKEIKGEIPPYLSAKSSDLLVSSIKKKKKRRKRLVKRVDARQTSIAVVAIASSLDTGLGISVNRGWPSIELMLQ
jgi:hypothetical protein